MDWTLFRWRAGAAVRLVLGAIWAWSSWLKLREPHEFLRAVQGYDITPDWLTKGIAYGLPVLGICLAALLIVGVLTRYAAGLSAFLLAAIFVGVLQAWIRGLNTAVGTFGGAGMTDSPRYPLHLLLILALLAGSVYLVIWPLTAVSVDGRTAQAYIVPEASTRAMRSARAQQRHRSLVERRAREARNEQLFLGGAVAAVVALICAIGISVQSGRAFDGVSTTAARATPTGGVAWGSADAPVTVDLYEDYRCKDCKEFQQLTANDLRTAVLAGQVKVRFFPIAYLETGSDGFSSRAANAALCASDISAESFVSFHNVAFGVGETTNGTPAPSESSATVPTSSAATTPAASQTPAATDAPTAAPTDAETGAPTSTNADAVVEGTTMTDELMSLGSTAGINDAAFSSCVEGDTHIDLVNAITDAALKAGVSGAPTIKVDGTTVSGDSPQELRTELLKQIAAKVATATAGGKTLAPYVPPVPAVPSPGVS